MTQIRARQLAAKNTKVPLQVGQGGLLYVDSKVGSASHKLLVDISLPYVVYKCESEDTCPAECHPSDGITVAYARDSLAGIACVDKVTADLELAGGLVVPSFAMGRIPIKHSFDLNEYVDNVVDGVLGVGLPDFPWAPNALDGNLLDAWSTYSLYVPPIGEEEDAFLFVGNVDDGPISTKSLTGFGFRSSRLPVPDFLLGGAETTRPLCFREEDCVAQLDSTTPFIFLSSTAWAYFRKYVEKNAPSCIVEEFGEDFAHVCNEDEVLPEIGFTIPDPYEGQISFFLKKEHYAVPHPDQRGKVVAMVYTRAVRMDMFTLGLPFFRAFYSSFDARYITFYCREDESCKMNYVPLLEPRSKEEEAALASSHPYGYIVGGIVGVLLAIVVAIFVFRRKRKAAKAKDAAAATADSYHEAASPTTATNADA